MRRRRSFETYLRRIAHSYGYDEVMTPIFEEERLFTEKSGPQVVDQLYTFSDKKGKRGYALRPELTASTMRMVSSEMVAVPRPLRIFYFGQCYRYERPQAGRYREFFQMGFEHVGAESPSGILDCIAMAYEMLTGVLGDNMTLRVGEVGILRALVTKALGGDEERRGELFRALDKGDTSTISDILGHDGMSILEGTVIGDLLDEEDRLGAARSLLTEDGDGSDPTPSGDTSDLPDRIAGLRTVLSTLHTVFPDAGDTISLDLSIARGLDYYSGIVFEVHVPTLGAESQVCGGGEYDLSGIFPLRDSTVGFAMGFDRVLLALPEEISFPGDGTPSRIGILFGMGLVGDDRDMARGMAFDAAASLRSHGYRAVVETKVTNVKKGLGRISDAGCTIALIIGGDEVANGTVGVKDLVSGDQVSVPPEELIPTVQGIAGQ